MKKTISFFSIVILMFSLCVNLASCDNFSRFETDEYSTTVHNNASGANEIRYSTSQGIKIESLSNAEQKLIDEYVEDCKTIYTAHYVENFQPHWEDGDFSPYIAFADIFVYDFRNADESNMDNTSLKLWNAIKDVGLTETRPIMYIQLSGYINYLNDYLITPLNEGSIVYGYFIYEDEFVLPYTYERICNRFYIYKLPEGTKIINCGDKYAEEKNPQDIIDFYEALGDYSNIYKFMTRLHLADK